MVRHGSGLKMNGRYFKGAPRGLWSILGSTFQILENEHRHRDLWDRSRALSA